MKHKLTSSWMPGFFSGIMRVVIAADWSMCGELRANTPPSPPTMPSNPAPTQNGANATDRPAASTTTSPAGTKPQIAPLNWQTERVSTIGKESIAELATNLANFDDVSMAETTSQSGVSTTEPDAQIKVVTRLARVRRLLEESAQHQDEIVVLMRHQLTDTLVQYDEAYAEIQRRQHASGGYSLSEPDTYRRLQNPSVVATYLLAILHDYKSLPLILEINEKLYKPDRFPITGALKQYGPVPPAITVYAAYLLIEAYPVKELSDSAKQAHSSFLDLAKPVLPPLIQKKVTTWNAAYEEEDPRLQVLDPNRITLRGQPSITIDIFPTKFVDGEAISDVDGLVSTRGRELLSKARAFATAAQLVNP